jgi:hypothetical protein
MVATRGTARRKLADIADRSRRRSEDLPRLGAGEIDHLPLMADADRPPSQR